MASTTVPISTRRDTGRKPGTNLAQTIILHIILALGAIVMVFPFIWMILTSFKDISQAFLIPPKWIPDPWVWENYPNSFQALPFDRAYFNSIYISIIVVGVTLITASMAAYAFAKITFPGRDCCSCCSWRR